MAQWAALFGGRRDNEGEGGSPVAAIVMMIVGPIAAMMVQMAISRYGSTALMPAERRLAVIRVSSRAPSKVAHGVAKYTVACISRHGPYVYREPAFRRRYVKLFSTHPPMEERIARLEAMRLH